MLTLTHISKSYGARGEVAALTDVSLGIGQGEFCAIVGASGCGKSTLLNIIGLLDRPDAGQVAFDRRVIDAGSRAEAARLRNELIGFVFQSFHLLPRLTAWQNAALPLQYRGVSRSDRRPRALEMLDQVGLKDRAEHLPSELSGGQSQRVALARALIGAPRLLLADEPTGSLDSASANDIMALLRRINREAGLTIVMVTHDRDLAARCDRRIELHDGQVVSAEAAA
ncbi:ABC transporter ATP-binding protein [Glycocaulis profundi]|nr:ABC transporter ATP-binding protein [Glycocaulis profundi]